VLTVSLPFPPPELNPNRKNGKSWRATNATKEAYKRDCWVLAVQAARGYVPPAGTFPLRLTFVQPPGRQRADADNLLASSKSALDGLAAALKVDDSRFEPLTVSRRHGDAPGALIVEVAP
jgi:crossover junction endodeoxyribonuclease RusA